MDNYYNYNEDEYQYYWGLFNLRSSQATRISLGGAILTQPIIVSHYFNTELEFLSDDELYWGYIVSQYIPAPYSFLKNFFWVKKVHICSNKTTLYQEKKAGFEEFFIEDYQKYLAVPNFYPNYEKEENNFQINQLIIKSNKQEYVYWDTKY